MSQSCAEITSRRNEFNSEEVKNSIKFTRKIIIYLYILDKFFCFVNIYIDDNKRKQTRFIYNYLAWK